VSCPDWKALAAWRDDPRAEEPAAWRQALAHLDQGCVQCRREAVAADPTLVFRRLAAVPEPSPAEEASEADAMRRAVAAMRAASRVEAAERHGHPARSMRSMRTLNWKRWAAAAALAVAALSMPGGDARLHRTPGLIPQATPAVLSVGGPAAVVLPAAALPAASADDLPTLEGVDRPGARVYHMDGEGLAGTMIFDETLDV